MTATRDEQLARAALTYLAEPADPAAAFLLTTCGPAGTLDVIRTGRLPPAARADATTVQLEAISRVLPRWQAQSEHLPASADLVAYERADIRLVCPGDTSWPGQLDVLGATRPYALWQRGGASLRDLCSRAISIAGSRAATAYGQHISATLAADLVAHGWTVIAGGAYGVDSAAHQAALAADGVTIAVLASGVDQPYPYGNHNLFEAITARGLLVSEWPPGTRPTRTRFALRSRVIAALSCGTVVVEAGPRSGALSTASRARQLSRHLMAVPGPVTSAASAGCHQIIRDWDAVCVTSADDIITQIAPHGPLSTPSKDPL